MWFMVCRWPQSQEGDWARPHLCKLARHGPWPVWKRFIGDHVWRGRWKSGCRIVGSVTIVWLSTEADDQSSLHCVIVSTDVTSDHIGHWDASRGGGCSKHTQANLDGLRRFEAHCQLPLYGIEKEVQHCWALAVMRAAWVAGSLKSGALNYEVGCRWDLWSWIWPTLGSSILRLSSKEPRLMCGGCLRWQWSTSEFHNQVVPAL